MKRLQLATPNAVADYFWRLVTAVLNSLVNINVTSFTCTPDDAFRVKRNILCAEQLQC